MSFNILVIAGLLILLVWVSWRCYKYYYISRALCGYFLDQIPDVETFQKWFRWAEMRSINTLLKRPKPQEPERARNYRAAPSARTEMDRRLIQKHIQIAFADISEAVKLEDRQKSLKYLRQYFNLFT